MALMTTIAQALAAVMADVQSVAKTGRNTEQGYNFRGVDAVVNAVGPALRKHGVVVLPMLETAAYRDVTTSRGKPSRECTVQVRYQFFGPNGDHVDAVVPGESMDFGDKGAAKAMSVAYRIALLQVLCIPTDDPEPDSQSYERARDDRPQWDPVEQDDLVTGWLAEIEDVKTLDALKDVGRRVLAAKQSGELSPASYDHLSQRGAARAAELQQEAGPA